MTVVGNGIRKTINILTTTYIIFVIVLIIIIYLSIKGARNIRIQDETLEKAIDSEFIYNPLTGSKLSFEQVNDKFYIDHNNANRIKSDAEIEEFFRQEEIDLEKTKRFLIKEKNITNLFDHEKYNWLKQKLGKLNIFNKYKSCSDIYLFASLKPKITLSVILVQYDLDLGYYIHEGKDYQYLGIVRLDRTLRNEVILNLKKFFLLKDVEILKFINTNSWSCEIYQNRLFIKLNKKLVYNEIGLFINLLNQIEQSHNNGYRK